MQVLQELAPSPRYIPPITEFTHEGGVEEHQVENIVQASVAWGTQTSSEAIEVDPYEETVMDDRSLDEVKADEQNEDLYSIKNFSV
jgi:hypothetical protein